MGKMIQNKDIPKLGITALISGLFSIIATIISVWVYSSLLDENYETLKKNIRCLMIAGFSIGFIIGVLASIVWASDETVRNFTKKAFQDEKFKIVIAIVFVIAFGAVIGSYTLLKADKDCKAIAQPFNTLKMDTMKLSMSGQYFIPPDSIKNVSNAIIKSGWYFTNRDTLEKNIINTRLNQHYKMVCAQTESRKQAMIIELKGRYFIVIEMIFMYGLAAALGFLILQKGWSEAGKSKGMLTALAASLAIATSFSFMPGALKQDENFNNNKNRYIQYSNLQENIRSYASIGLLKGKFLRPQAFINYIDSAMASLNDVNFGISDPSKVRPFELGK